MTAASHVLTDTQVREIYAYLIEKSWEDADHFTCHQEAWTAIARIIGVRGIKDNGHGSVERTQANDGGQQ